MLEDEQFGDPHVHAQSIVTDRGQIRAALTRAPGRAPTLPATVVTACRQRRPVAMTSVLSARVTCLVCRKAAREAHLRAAEALEARPMRFPLGPALATGFTVAATA